MKIQAYKCRFDGKIFQLHQREKYIAHLKSLRNSMKEKRSLVRARREFKDWLDNEKSKIVNVDMIAPWFLENQKKIMHFFNAYKNEDAFGREFYPEDKFVEFELKGLNYSNKVSNTHSCPVNGVTNWRSDDNLPRGYPGWQGFVSCKFEKDPKNKTYAGLLEICKFVNLHPGTGGSSNGYYYSYDVKIFLGDWPELERQLVVDKLKGK